MKEPIFAEGFYPFDTSYDESRAYGNRGEGWEDDAHHNGSVCLGGQCRSEGGSKTIDCASVIDGRTHRDTFVLHIISAERLLIPCRQTKHGV